MRKEFRRQAEHIVRNSGINFVFPAHLDFSAMPPIQFIYPYHIDYLHSYGQDSPFFLGLKQKKLLGSLCATCNYRYATPRGTCLTCGNKTTWFELPSSGLVHAFTVCHFGSEAFIHQTPYALALVEFSGVDTLFLSRLKMVDMGNPSLDWIGMPVIFRFSRRVGKEKYIPSVTDVWFVPSSLK